MGLLTDGDGGRVVFKYLDIRLKESKLTKAVARYNSTHSRHIVTRKLILGVGDQKAGFPHSSITDNHALKCKGVSDCKRTQTGSDLLTFISFIVGGR